MAAFEMNIDLGKFRLRHLVAYGTVSSHGGDDHEEVVELSSETGFATGFQPNETEEDDDE